MSSLTKWQHLYADELEQVNDVMRQNAESHVPLIPQMVEHIIASGGKRLRPILTILCAKLCGYEGDRHIRLAAAIEFLHTATLLHDDVVDESTLRRGRETANEIWDNKASVLVGDYLLGRAFQLMSRDGSIKVLQLLSDTSAIITQGEVAQLTATNDITTDEATYTSIIRDKTAQLFTAACQIGAVITEADDAKESALAQFGTCLGTAFQIADDALDYSAKQAELGKTIGDDFREGKMTLPVIYAYQAAEGEEKTFWQNAIEQGGSDDDLPRAIELISQHEILPRVFARAEECVHEGIAALKDFPDGDIKSALTDIIGFSVKREY